MAEELKEAMDGWGTDESTLIDVITSKTFEEIATISEEYETEYEKNLIDHIKSECSGDFEDVLVALCTPRAHYDAKILHSAFSGMGTDESLMFEVMCTRTNQEIQAIKAAYEELYEEELVTRLEGENSGNLEKLMVELCNENEDEKKSEDDVASDVKNLYKAGAGKWGTDEGVFIRFAADNSREHREQVYYAYAEEYGDALDKVIKSEFSGGLEKALIILCSPLPAYYAEILKNAMEGLGTNENTIIRVIVSQKERFLQQIAECYLNTNKETLEAHIKSEISGNFKKAVIAVCNNFAKLGDKEEEEE